MPVLFGAVALLGLAVGSFLNVVIHRVPAGLSLLRPASHCPACAAPVRFRHNVPVLGWLLLRGRCADCSAPISVRYPLVELVTAALFVATTAQLARTHLLAALPALLAFAAVGVALAAIDLDVHRLPNPIVLAAYLALVPLLGLAALLEHSPQSLLRAALGGTGLFALYLGLALARPGGMGLGDVKLSGVIGAVLGFLSWPALLVGAFAAFLLGGTVAVAALLARRATRRSLLPFGPAMITGAFVAIFASAPIADSYVHLLQRS